jgi:hypothetical protein
MDPGSSSSDAALIPVMDYRSSSDLAEIPGMDPGSSSSNAALILGTSFLSFPYTMATTLVWNLSVVSLHSLLSSHNSNEPILEFVCPFLNILSFPHTMATTTYLVIVWSSCRD